ncbi:MAG: DUF3810 domain-containing protein [Cellulosilyticaceae bacterium]
MNKTKLKLLLLLLFPLAILLNYLYTLAPDTWESFYSLGINKWFIMGLSHVTGILPFSLFEFGIYGGVLWLLGYTFYTLYKLIKNFRKGFAIVGQYLLTLASLAAVGIFVFMSFWALNYKRPHFSEKYGIVAGEYTSDELAALYQHLLNKATRTRHQLPEDADGLMVPYGDYKDIFNRAQAGFDQAGLEFTSLKGSYGNAKPILASEPLNYTGITGIYSPFTGEPNVNISVPAVTLPSTTCHEMAHQRGYGFENECNFIAYITCLSHPDLDFQYSGLIMALSYTSNALATADYDALVRINSQMDPKVYADLASINTFWDQYEGDVQEVSEKVNNAYLQSNGVASGTASYGEMVNLLLALYDKYH